MASTHYFCRKITVFITLTIIFALAPPSFSSSSEALYDPDGYLYDVQTGSGTRVYNGTSDAYDNAYYLRIDGVNYNAGNLTVSGRNIVGTTETLSGLEVMRKLYVPYSKVGSLGNFGRWYDSLYNPTASPITVNVEYYGNLGSDGSTVLTGSSDGDTILETTDQWFATDDSGDGSGDPSLAHWINLTGAREIIDYVNRSEDVITWRYENVCIEPGQTAAFLTFAVQEQNRASSLEEANGILDSVATGDLNSIALKGLLFEEWGKLVNIPVILDDLRVEPLFGFASQGKIGGPFTPSSKTYTVTNDGPNSLDWAVLTPYWLTAEPNDGTLAPGDSNTVTISIIEDIANTLPTGTYYDTITFTNTTSGVEQTRKATLLVGIRKVLAYIQYADVSREYPNTLAAIDSVSTNYTLTKLTDYTQLDSMLPGHDILLIPEQENADSSQLEAIGVNWATTVQNFVNNGGVVIQCIHVGQYQILTGSGLMTIFSSSTFEGLVTVVAPSDPVAAGVSSTYIGENGSAYVNTPEGVVVAERTGYGPVVINKQMGLGNVVFIGHDYYNSNPNQDRIVGNAVFNIPVILDDLRVEPLFGFASQGKVGGPFAPSSKTYTLTNNGPNSLDFSLNATQSWLTVTPSGGTLGPGDSNTVKVSINTNANILGFGSYTDTVTFSNLTSGINYSRSVELIVRSTDNIYWVDDGTNKIQRSDLNGAFVEDLVTGLSTPRGIAVDMLGDKMYWTDYGTDKIQRANLDGSNVEDLVTTGLSSPTGIALDVLGGKMYWADYGTNKIQRANLDGSNVEDLVIGLSDPHFIALDVLGGKMYWTDFGTDKIQRANLDGSNVEDLVTTGLYTPYGITLDRQRGKIYWTDYGDSIIKRANLDGSNVETVITGLSDPAGITIPEIPYNLVVTPWVGFSCTGQEKGPFDPNSKDYTLENIGANSLDWAVLTPYWLTAEPNNGTLAPGDSNTVTISIIEDIANLLEPNVYTGTIAFTNLTSGYSRAQIALLTVIRIPGEINITDSIPPADDNEMPFGDVIIGLPRNEQITITNDDPIHELIVEEISLGGSPGSSYFEDFEDGLAQDWSPLVSANWSVLSGEYRAYTNSYGFNMESIYMGSAWENCSVQAVMRRYGDTGSAARLVFRTTDDFSRQNETGSAYMVAISGNGNYYVGMMISGVFSFIQGWTSSPYLNTGNSTNIVMVNVNGSSIDVYFNGYLAWSGTHSSISGSGRIGLLGYRSSSGNTTYYFDDVSVGESVPASQVISSQQQWYNEHPYESGNPENAPEDWEPPQYPNQQQDSPVQPQAQILSSNGFQLENIPDLPVTIPPLAAITIDVNFAPTEVTDYNTTVIIKSDDRDEPEIAVHLTGAGIIDYLEIIPDFNCVFSGHPGGPFVPTNKSYQLINVGPVPIDWTVEPNTTWLDISPSAGSLQPGQSDIVVATCNLQADVLPQGYHCCDLAFTDVTTTLTQHRNVSLNIYTEPKIWTKPSAFDITLSQGSTETVLITIGNTGGSDLEFSLSSTQTGFTQPESDTAADANEFSVSAQSSPDFTILGDNPFVKGELLVRFAPEPNTAEPNLIQKTALLDTLGGGESLREYQIVPGLCLVKLPEDMTVEEALVSFNQADGILYAQPNYELKADATTPDDPMFGDLWGMHNIGQTGGTVDADIDAPEAWDITTGNKNIIVAVIDSGVDYTHPDLAENMWVNEAELNGSLGIDDDGNGYIDDIYGYDFYNNDGDPMDDHYHGTHCAGTIGAVGNNAQGVAGVCWKVSIMALKFLDSSGYGSSSDAIGCIEYSVLTGAHLSSNSWGGGSYNQALKDAIDAAGTAGMLFVASAGNDYGNNNDIYPHYPSSYDCDSIIAVMSTDKYDNISTFSNYGHASVDIGAPGSDIYSCKPYNQYQYLSGTSMAGPHVAGACALVWALNQGLSNTDVKNILLDTVDETLPGKCVSQGRLNLYNALTEVGTQWLEFTPASGTVAQGQSQQINVIFNADTPPGTYQGLITVYSNDPYEPQKYIPVTLTVEPIDFFTELFEPGITPDPNDPNNNDLAYRTLTFRPNSSADYYALCVDQASEFPVDSNGGTTIELGDDDYYIATLDDAQINFYGTTYDTLYIGSNGYISFVSGDIRHFETLNDHFELPRISALFDDLDPSAGGNISFIQLDDRVVITFKNVPEYSLENSNSFQFELRFNGNIRITLLNIDANDGLVGISDGNGLDPYYIKSDLSKYDLCNFIADLNNDLNVDFADFAIFAVPWKLRYTEPVHQSFTVADEFNSISYSGNDGDLTWTYDWQEIGESDGPAKGRVQIVPDTQSNALRIRRSSLEHGLTRQVDLSSADYADLSFDWKRQGNSSSDDMKVAVSADAGQTWTTIFSVPEILNEDYHSESFDISDFIAADTQIHFLAKGGANGYVYFDNIKIDFGIDYEPLLWCADCDFNNDLIIDANDLSIFGSHWLE